MEASNRNDAEAARSAGARAGAARTLAQTFCLVAGLGLIAAGILGFFFGGSNFAAIDPPRGEEFIVFEVNGWHNIVHIATGAFLVLMSPKARLAAIGALTFGVVYVVVVIWGFIDGNDIAEIVALNTADNWLHVALAIAGIAVGLMAGALGASANKTDPSGRAV